MKMQRSGFDGSALLGEHPSWLKLKERNNKDKDQYIGHTSCCEELNDSSRSSWYVWESNQNGAGSNDGLNDSKHHRSNHSTDKISHSSQNNYHEAGNDIGSTEIGTHGAKQGNRTPSHTSQARSNAKGDAIDAVSGNTQAMECTIASPGHSFTANN